MSSDNLFAIELHDEVLHPAAAEVRITAHAPDLRGNLELRGRLMGPRCPYATTVEVAYPVRPLPRQAGDATSVTARVIIPEPNFWEPESPFLYGGPIELWQDGQCTGQRTITHVLRTVQLSTRGLRLNGRRLAIRGVAGEAFSEADLRRLHHAGCNLLLLPAPSGAGPLWADAQAFGFLTLARLSEEAADAVLRHAQEEEVRHPAPSLGWLVPQKWLGVSSIWETVVALLHGSRQTWVGVQVTETPTSPFPPQVSFLACNVDLLSQLTPISLPKVLLTGRVPSSAEDRWGTSSSADLVGWIATTP